MSVSAINKPQIIEYLLGRLRGEEMLELEGKLLADDNVYELIEETEYELINAYLVDRLSSADRRQFESYFLRSPKRKEQLEFSRSMHQVAGEHLKSLAEQASPGASYDPSAAVASAATPVLIDRVRSWWQSLIAAPQFAALATACLLLLAGGLAWSLVRNGQLREQLSQEQTARAALEQKTAAQVESLNRKLGKERSLQQELIETVNRLTGSDDPGRPIFYSAVLSVSAFLAGSPKGGEEITPQKLVIPAGADAARLQLPLQTDRFVRFDVSLIRLDGSERNEIWRRRGLTAPAGKEQNLKVRVPAALLNNGEYALKLTGIDDDNSTESVGEFRFEVVRQK